MPKETTQEQSIRITPEESKRLEELKELLIDFIDKIDLPQKIEVIDDIIYRLNFERRFSLLSDEEKKFIMDDDLIYPVENQRIKDAVSKEVKDEMISDLARIVYFRKIAWMDYLNGKEDVSPFFCGRKK